MKTVLFCGGLGMRLREHSDSVPKPMVNIGYRPILWHIMKYYAHYGHTDFILCLGYKGDAIKSYFLDYDECLSNDFVLSDGGNDIHLLNRDIQDWKITFVDTGIRASIGERLKAVQQHLQGEKVFMANYADGLTDLRLPEYVDMFLGADKTAGFLAVRSPQSFHVVSVDQEGLVSSIAPISESNVWLNGGFFIFRDEIFDHLGEGEDLVYGPYHRLIEKKKLFAYKYEGFWAAMDTFKDREMLVELHKSEHAPWEVWRRQPALGPDAPPSAPQSFV